MNHTRLWIAAAIIALIVIASFVLSVPHTREVAVTIHAPAAPASVPVVTLQDAFKKNLHTITGSIEASDACVIVTANATVTGTASSTQKILVTISMPSDTGGVCLQLPTPMSFKTTVSAPEGLPLIATVNGIAASTTAP